MSNFSERHLIIVPVALQAQANAEAVKWDADSGGATTFGGSGLSSDSGATKTHVASCGLIDADYFPSNQNGQNALQVLDAFYATGWYQGYKIIRGEGDASALLNGAVYKYMLHPSRWELIGEGSLVDIALADAGLVRYVEPMPESEPEIAEWVQPTGAHDAYQIGDRVTYQGKTWESTVANNVWAPGVYGWTEVA